MCLCMHVHARRGRSQVHPFAREAAHVSVYACACACRRACGCRLAYVRVCVRVHIHECMIIILYYYICELSVSVCLWVRMCGRVCTYVHANAYVYVSAGA